MNSLKRQASKAERFAQVRDELRERLRVVLASRMAMMDSEQARLEQEIAEFGERIATGAGEIATAEASQHSLTERGYALDHEAQDAQNRANASAVELERAAARQLSNAERVSELEARIAAAAGELETTQTQLGAIAEERTQQKSFMETAAGEAHAFHEKVQAKQHEARAAADEVFNAERKLEMDRRHAMHLLTLAGNARNSTAQAEESLAALEREAERLNAEMSQARNEQESLGVQSGQARLKFESAAEMLKRLEDEIAELRQTLQARRSEESSVRTRANQLRSDQAGVAGRRDSLQSLIRDPQLFDGNCPQASAAGALQNGSAPVGTLADFIEVSGEHEGVVDEFLRDELNYVRGQELACRRRGRARAQVSVDGRATFLIHPENSSGHESNGNGSHRIEAEGRDSPARAGAAAEWVRTFAGNDPAKAARWLSRRDGATGAGHGKRARPCLLPYTRRRMLPTTRR